jgi:3-(3-hydroxy-phenyl)propionate hydroxylase
MAAMTEHAVVIAGGGPTGLLLAGELALVTPPTAVLVRPDGYVAWVGDVTQLGLTDALTTWFGPRTGA